MKRFIDLRGQHTLHRFAWWCTVRDEFDSYAGDQAWCTWDEFVESVKGEGPVGAMLVIPRYDRLCPAWAREPDPDDDHDEDTADPTSV